MTIVLGVSGVRPAAWGAKEWDLALRENKRMLELAAKCVNGES
jgi:hypothetical protein